MLSTTPSACLMIYAAFAALTHTCFFLHLFDTAKINSEVEVSQWFPSRRTFLSTSPRWGHTGRAARTSESSCWVNPVKRAVWGRAKVVYALPMGPWRNRCNGCASYHGEIAAHDIRGNANLQRIFRVGFLASLASLQNR